MYSIPGRYESFRKEVDYVKHLFRNRQELKVENAGIGVLFALECLAWFYGGEIVGRGFTFTGYHVWVDALGIDILLVARLWKDSYMLVAWLTNELFYMQRFVFYKFEVGS